MVRLHARFLSSIVRCNFHTSFLRERGFAQCKFQTGAPSFCSKSSPGSKIQIDLGGNSTSNNNTETSSFSNEFVENKGDAETSTFAKEFVENNGDPEPHAKISDEDYMRPQPRKERIRRALGKLRKGPDGRFINVLEVVSDLDMLIAAYQSLKAQSRPTYLIEDSDDEDSMEGIKLERFKRLQKRLRNGTYRFGTVKEADNKEDIEELDDFSSDED